MKSEIIQEVSNVVNRTMEALITKTVVAINCDFDQKLALLQPQYIKQEDVLVDFQFDPVSSAIELEELDKNLSDKAYAKDVVG